MTLEQDRIRFLSRIRSVLHPDYFKKGYSITKPTHRKIVRDLLFEALVYAEKEGYSETPDITPIFKGSAVEYLESLRVGWRVVVPDRKTQEAIYRDYSSYVNIVRDNIETYGDEALGHLVLAQATFNQVRRRLIYTQKDLAEYLAHPIDLKGIGPTRLLELHTKFDRLNQLKEQFPD